MRESFARSTFVIALTGLAVGVTPHVAVAATHSSLDPADSFTVVILNDPQFQLWEEGVNPYPFWFLLRCGGGFLEFDLWFPPGVGVFCTYDEWLVVENKTKAAAIRKIGKRDITHWPDTGAPISEPIAVIINGDLVHERDYLCSSVTDRWSRLLPGKLWSEHLYWHVFVDYLRDIPVLPGLGNHDVQAQWQMGPIMVNHLLAALQQHPDRDWVNFRLPDGAENLQVDLQPPDQEIPFPHGSLSYSWDYGNYRFLQINGDLLDIPGFRLTLPHREWVEDRFKEAAAEGKRIVINEHAAGDPFGLVEGSNVVASFDGHTHSGKEHRYVGFKGYWMKPGGEGPYEVLNAFGLPIPVFQAGHALFADYGESHKLLVAEFADTYLKVGVIDTWTDTWRPRRDPWGFDPPTFYSVPDLPAEKFLFEIGPFHTGPTVSIPPSGTVAEGDAYAVHGTFTDTDPHPEDSFAVSADYGDGTGVEELAYYSGEFDLHHRYGDDGVYTVTVSVTDEDGNEGTGQATVTVSNVAPSVGPIDMPAPAPFFILPGVRGIEFSASFSDPGWLDVHASEWDFGDGVIEPGAVAEENEYPDSTGSTEATHTYAAPGTFTVTVGVADDEGAVGAATTTVQVSSAREALWAIAEYIAGLPAACFPDPSENRRHALLRKLRAVDRMLIAANYQGAAKKLCQDLRGKVDGLVDEHSRNDFIVDQAAQEEICGMLDDLCAFLDWAVAIKGASYGPVAQPRPPVPPGGRRHRR